MFINRKLDKEIAIKELKKKREWTIDIYNAMDVSLKYADW